MARIVGRVLEGAEREAAIAQFVAWLELGHAGADFSEAPIARFVEERGSRERIGAFLCRRAPYRRPKSRKDRSREKVDAR